MKKIILIFGALVFLSCGSKGSKQVVAAETTTIVNKVTEAPVTPAGVGELLSYLADDALEGRDTGSEGIEMAASYIAAYFQEAGVKPFYPQYRDTLQNVEGYAANVVGYLEGSDPELKHEIVVIGAHYDHIGMVKPVEGDSIANGANDNATGTVAVMELARKMAGMNHRRSVLFALFTAEEKGLKGSAHLAQRLKEEGRKVYTVINFEMLGVPMKRDYLVYMTGFEMSNMAAVMNAVSKDTLVGFLPTAKQYRLFQRSDNYPFYKSFGVPAHTLSTFDFTNFEHYHQAGDEFELMNPDHMARVIRDLLPSVSEVVNSDKNAVQLNASAASE